MTTATPVHKTPPPRPAPRSTSPRPLWERHQLFQEPAYSDGQPYTADDDNDDDEPAIITP